jgi:mono/diheme cytochrome c family protein
MSKNNSRFLAYGMMGIGGLLLVAGIAFILIGSVVGATSPAAPTPTIPASAGAEQGLKTFREFCTACHPGDGRRPGNGPALINTRSARDYPYLIRQVRSGKGTMPAFPVEMLPDENLASLYLYLSGLK